MDKELKDKIVGAVKSVPVFNRHIVKKGTFYGNTYCAPITIWATTIEIMVDTRRNYFKKALKKFVDEHPEVAYASFVKGDGSITPYLYFSIK